MKKSTYYMSLDIERIAAQGCMSVRRGESGRRLRVQLVSGGRPYAPGEDCHAVFAAKKPDGTTLFNGCTLSGSAVDYILTAQTTAAAGRLECEIRIYGADGELVIAPAFGIYVFPEAADEDELASGPEAYWPPRMICEGMSGSDVAAAQALLRARGIECPAAGVFDAQTRAAVLTFQARRGLDRDGIAGGMTWGALLDRARP